MHNLTGDFQLNNDRIQSSGDEQLTFSGIGYYHPELFAGLAYGRQALAPILRKAMDKGMVSGEKHSGDWQDIGTPERLVGLDKELLERK